MVVKEKKEAKKRSEVAIIGDVNPMKEALKDLETLPVASKMKTKSTRREKRLRKQNKDNNSKLTSKDLRKPLSKKVQKHK